ncbi:hypothetical protein [Halobacteriovorax sp.]|uniref:hypothetical protein n=1 Tax=Halobacteriovorax sp. TaxID=2020862 RepID=UPI003568A375
MRIPIYEELILDNYSVEYLKDIIKSSKIGSLPMYSSLHNIPNAEKPLVISNIEIALRELQKSPYFPYPYYIVSDYNLKSAEIEIFNSVEELPSHYFKKSKRLKNKELMLLNKVSVICEKVSNMQIYNKQKVIDNSSLAQKALYKKTKELNFYEEVTSIIQKSEN